MSTGMEPPAKFFSLTSLQIGKIRRYPSRSFLYSAPDSNKLLILVVSEVLLVFEVAWKDVCGIKYTNDLQTDASVALEAESIQKWIFQEPGEASRCLSSWFSGTDSEAKNLMDFLNIMSDARTEIVGTDNHLSEGNSFGDKVNHAFLLFKFIDDSLTGELRRKILDDIRLRKVLELGIPSWAIFVQSYPPFSSCYRPWMRRLVRETHGLIVFVSFMIAFYDLYRNIPIIKADVLRLWNLLFRLEEAFKFRLSQNVEKARNCLLETAKLLAEPLVKAGMGIFIGPIWAAMELIFRFIGVLISLVISKTATLIWKIILPGRLLLRAFSRWLEASEMLSFSYLAAMFLLQNFVNAIKWFLETGKQIVEGLPSLGLVWRISIDMKDTIPHNPFVHRIRDSFKLISSFIAQKAETGRNYLRDRMRVLCSFSAESGRGYSWRDLRDLFLSRKLFGSVKTVVSGLFDVFRRGSKVWRFLTRRLKRYPSSSVIVSSTSTREDEKATLCNDPSICDNSLEQSEDPSMAPLESMQPE